MNTVLFKKSAVFSIIGAVFLLAGGQAAASSRIKILPILKASERTSWSVTAWLWA